MCYLALQQGWFTKEGRAAGVLKPLIKATPSAGQTKKTTMREVSERERQQRDRCQNTLHLSAIVLGNSDIQYDCALAAWLTLPQQEEHSDLAKHLSSLDFAEKMCIDFAAGTR